MAAAAGSNGAYSASGTFVFDAARVSFNVSGLAQGTKYDLYFVAQDVAGNLPTSPTPLM